MAYYTFNEPEDICSAGGYLWATSYDSLIRVSTTGAITNHLFYWCRAPWGIIDGGDNCLWMACQGQVQAPHTTSGFGTYPGISLGSIGRYNYVTNTFTDFKDAGLYYPRDICNGPDGNKWFTTYGGGSNFAFSYTPGCIGKITPAGVITLYPLPGSHPSAWQMCLGPDGNIWFYYSSLEVDQPQFSQRYSYIAKINPTTGIITSYATPGNVNVMAIISPGDGNLWAVNYPDGIIKCTTDGVMTQFTDVAAIKNPDSLTIGPDGHIWATNFGTYTAGVHYSFLTRINISSGTPVLTVFQDPEYGLAGPWGICTGPDNNLWFVNNRYDNILNVDYDWGAVGTFSGWDVP